MEVTDEQLIEDFNSETMTYQQIADKHGKSITKIKSAISKCQRNGLVGKKNKSGKIIKNSKKSQLETKNKGGDELLNLLNGVGDLKIDKENISISHKEMLIEILHRVL